MVYILSFKSGHDASACLLKDGVIVAAAEEERFTRKKPFVGNPWHSVSYCLAQEGITLEEVDEIVFARKTALPTAIEVTANYFKHPPLTYPYFRYFLGHMKVQVTGLLKALGGLQPYQQVLPRFKPPGSTKRFHVSSYDHHLCHAASSYLVSGFKEANVLTYDGKGEACSGMLARASDGVIEPFERIDFPNSLALAYMMVTHHLGFKPMEEEYHVMGLAPFGKPKIDLDFLLRLEARGYRINPEYCFVGLSDAAVAERLGPRREIEAPLTEYHKNLAASIQARLEEAILKLVAKLVEKNGSKNLAIGGGVGFNVKANQRILQSGLVNRVFIQPAAGDAGNVVGAAIMRYLELGHKPRYKMEHAYLGPGYSDDEIKATLLKSKAQLSFEETRDVAGEAAELLAKGKVIGWFQGRMEFGPRALGNRSILANPRDAAVKDKINAMVKERALFRPFCPTIPQEKAKRYLQIDGEFPFMTFTVPVTEAAVEEAPAIVHVDGTTRPQTLRKEHNPVYYRLIREFEKQTGTAIVLNTSLNRHEPIVASPTDAINTFLGTRLDAMAIGNYLAFKRGNGLGR